MPPTPFMGLTLPTVGITLGPEWATELNAALVQVDAHNHTTGQGVPIPTNGISLNADLGFNGYNATLLRSTRYNSQASPLSAVTDIACLYVSGGNLFYNNLLGQQVQITQGAGLDASTVGGFGGDYGTSTASAFYTSATSTFTFWQAPSQSALMDFGPFTIHNTASIATGITIQAPNPLASSYQLTLPNALPSSTKILTVSNSGQIGDVYDVDNVTLQVVSNTLQIAPAGVGNAQIAANSVDQAQLQALPYVTSSSSGSFTTTSGSFVTPTNLSVMLTCSGRPITLMLIPDHSGNQCYVGASYPGSLAEPINLQINTQFLIDGSSMGVGFAGQVLTSTSGPSSIFYPPASFQQYWVPSPGAHTFTFQISRNATVASTVAVVNFCQLVVFEH